MRRIHTESANRTDAGDTKLYNAIFSRQSLSKDVAKPGDTIYCYLDGEGGDSRTLYNATFIRQSTSNKSKSVVGIGGTEYRVRNEDIELQTKPSTPRRVCIGEPGKTVVREHVVSRYL